MDANRSGKTRSDSTKALLVRLPVGILSDLRQEASKEQASVNSFILGILRRHLSWGRFQQKLGFMPLHRSMVAAILDKLTCEEIENIGMMQKDQTIRDFLLFNSGYNLDSFIDWIDLRCGMMGFHLVLKQETNSILVIIHHGMGQKWSLYYKGLFSSVLEELLPAKSCSKMTFTTTDSLFSVQIHAEMQSS
jgi:hypothetical protein